MACSLVAIFSNKRANYSLIMPDLCFAPALIASKSCFQRFVGVDAHDLSIRPIVQGPRGQPRNSGGGGYISDRTRTLKPFNPQADLKPPFRR
jgi:hypothetical protein